MPVVGPSPVLPSTVAKKSWLRRIDHSSHHLAQFSSRSLFLALVARDRPSIRPERARQEPSAASIITIDKERKLQLTGIMSKEETRLNKGDQRLKSQRLEVLLHRRQGETTARLPSVLTGTGN
ncbi:hypothetical protein JCGZ_18610 [Jatropha curcas]|uniref:Uncharacterized protein n=1 Tax=Jatropha curcas TaxID=180498 RepID=A0A067KDU8_JATCU|nr:hypothetical protein JCGZ_18610 [Jatropha curcas]